MINQHPIRPNQVESYLRVILIERPDAAPLAVRTEEGAANSFSSLDPLFEMPDAPNFEDMHQASSADGHRQSSDSPPDPGQVTLLLHAPKDRPKCISEYEAVGLVGLARLPPFHLMLGTSLRANPFDVNGRPAFATTPAVLACELVHPPLHLNGHWLPPVSYTQIPPDEELGGPIWDKLLRDIVLSVGRYIFPGGNRKLGFVTPHRDTEASLINFFGSIEGRDKPPPTLSLWDAVEARLLRFLPDARHNRRSTMRYNPYEDPTQLGRVMREQGWWPQLRHYVSMITATKAVGPTHGLWFHGGCPRWSGQSY